MVNNIDKFLDDLMTRLMNLGVDVANLDLDHIGYKTENSEEYDRLKPEFEKMGIMVKEYLVRERRVGIFKLDNPIKYKNYSIRAIELIAPKPEEIVRHGWEHAEFVLNESYEDFMKKYSTLEWDVSAMNADQFPVIKLKLGEDMQAKFHLMPILETITQGAANVNEI